MKTLSLFSVLMVVILSAGAAFAKVSCICGPNHKFIAPNKTIALKYCSRITHPGYPVNLHDCAPAPAAAYGFDVNNCSPQISCGSCAGYSGEYTQQTCHVVNCDGSISDFQQDCTAP